MTELEQKYISLRELATVLGISKTYAHKLVIGGKIKAIKVGTVWRVPVEEIEKIQKVGV